MAESITLRSITFLPTTFNFSVTTIPTTLCHNHSYHPSNVSMSIAHSHTITPSPPHHLHHVHPHSPHTPIHPTTFFPPLYSPMPFHPSHIPTLTHTHVTTITTIPTLLTFPHPPMFPHHHCPALFTHHHCPHTFPHIPTLVSCPPRARLPARNGLVNEVEFLGLIHQNGGRPMRLRDR